MLNTLCKATSFPVTLLKLRKHAIERAFDARPPGVTWGRWIHYAHSKSSNHSRLKGTQFEPSPLYPTPRTRLVQHTIDLLLKHRVLVIRAPPQSGKSTLLQLIGAKIIRNHLDLDPVHVVWPLPHVGKTLRERPWYAILNDAWGKAFDTNRVERQTLNLDTTNSPEERVFLIDEAVNTYHDINMWDKLFKNPIGREYYVLFCSYGSASEPFHQWGPSYLSEASTIGAERRIELYRREISPKVFQPSILLEEHEMREMVDSWLHYQTCKEYEDDFIPFLRYQTQGHVGMLERMLQAIGRDAKRDLLTAEQRRSFIWNGRICQYLMEKGGFYYRIYLTGVLTEQEFSYIAQTLDYYPRKEPEDGELTFFYVRDSLKKVASSLDGLVSPMIKYEDPDPALQYVHRMGLLHSQQDGGQTVYRFPSRCHRRFAWNVLFETPDPVNIPLKEACVKAIEYLNCAIVPTRPEIPPDQCNSTEAQIQKEMFNGLRRVLPTSLIEVEFTPPKKSGPVDFLIPSQKWAIGLLQNGTTSQIVEHALRLSPKGRYGKWGVVDEYIIINFCQPTERQDLKSSDLSQHEELFERTYQVVMYPDGQIKIFRADGTEETSFILGT